jgi:hypothetical protein
MNTINYYLFYVAFWIRKYNLYYSLRVAVRMAGSKDIKQPPPTGERIEPGPLTFELVSVRNLIKPKSDVPNTKELARMLEITLTDGTRTVKAGEWKRINSLKYQSTLCVIYN